MFNFLKRKKTGMDLFKYLKLLHQLRDECIDYDYWNKVYSSPMEKAKRELIKVTYPDCKKEIFKIEGKSAEIKVEE